MSEFDQSLLKKALADARLPVNGGGASGLSVRLQEIRDQHLPRATAEIENKALERIGSDMITLIQRIETEISEDNLGSLRVILQPPGEIELIDYLNRSLEVVKAWLIGEESGKSGQKAETTLFVKLYDLYVDLTGSTKIGSDKGGPLYRFVLTCAQLVDDQIRDPGSNAFRSRLIKALKRRDKLQDLSVLADKITQRMTAGRVTRKRGNPDHGYMCNQNISKKV